MASAFTASLPAEPRHHLVDRAAAMFDSRRHSVDEDAAEPYRATGRGTCWHLLAGVCRSLETDTVNLASLGPCGSGNVAWRCQFSLRVVRWTSGSARLLHAKHRVFTSG